MSDLIVQVRLVQPPQKVVLIKSSVVLKSNEVEYIQCDISNASGVDRLIQRLHALHQTTVMKAIIFTIDVFDYPSFTSFLQFRKKVQTFCQTFSIGCFFYTSDASTFDAVLCRTKPVLKEGESAFIIRKIGADSDGYSKVEGILVVKEPGNRGYRFVKQHKSRNCDYSTQWKKLFLDGSNPVVVIVISFDGDSKKYIMGMKRLFKDENLILYDFGRNVDDINETTSAKVMHEMGEKVNPYNLLPMCLIDLFLEYGGSRIASITRDVVLPHEKELVLDVDPLKSITLYTSAFRNTVIQCIKMADFHCKKVRILFKVDKQSFHDLKVVPVEDEKPDGNDTTPMNIKALIRFGKQDFIVSLFENGIERTLKDSKGVEKIPTFISFVNKVPVVGDSAIEDFKTHLKFVVYDIVKLCSISSPDVINPKWQFRLSKEDEGIVVHVETHEGERCTTPAFLMALLFRNVIKMVRLEIGERLKEFDVCFDGHEPNETLKKNLLEAANLKNIKIVFV